MKLSAPDLEIEFEFTDSHLNGRMVGMTGPRAAEFEDLLATDPIVYLAFGRRTVRNAEYLIAVAQKLGIDLKPSDALPVIEENVPGRIY